MGKFVIKENKKGFNFNLLAVNMKVIGVSETYSSHTAAVKGTEAVVKAAAKAGIEDQTKGESAKNPKFEIFLDKAGEFRFHLKATNGEIVLASQGYKTRASARKGIASVIKNAPEADVEG